MDLLYHRYARPMELLERYISAGRFDSFAKHLLETEQQRIETERTRHQEEMLWLAYLQSGSGDSFDQWRQRLLTPPDTAASQDQSMTETDIQHLLNRLFFSF